MRWLHVTDWRRRVFRCGGGCVGQVTRGAGLQGQDEADVTVLFTKGGNDAPPVGSFATPALAHH